MQIRFRLNKGETRIGQNFHIIGNLPQLANWNPLQAPSMVTDKTRYPIWEMKDLINLNDDQAAQTIEYKYIIKQNDQIKWEDGNNRVLNLKEYHGTSGQLIIEDFAFNQIINPRIYSSSQIINNGITLSQYQEETKHYEENNSTYKTYENQFSSYKIEAKQSQNNSQQNKTVSNTLTQDIIKDLQSLNAEKGTWKQKLEVVAQLVDSYSSYKNFTTEGLAILSAYLYFVNSHQIKCAENGTHFRPNHHANIAFSLYQTLDKELTTDDNSFIIRSLKKNLVFSVILNYFQPSFADQFTVSVPLTRIRDIAHRNDIPHDLKNDIKHRLQNKLHRSADPGDLKTCEELIHRVRNGDYNGDFKYQFELFYEELKEFFNAMGLDKLLNQIQQQDLSMGGSIQEFIQKKNSNQINEGNIQLITNLRKLLKEKLENIYGDHSKKALYQYLQLADIDLEQYLFVKLSEILSNVHQLRSFDDIKRILVLSLTASENMIISNLYSHELSIISNELIGFGLNSDTIKQEPLNLKRLKSAVERGLRLGKGFTNQILDTFQTNVQDLGSAFGIDKHSVEVFSESFVRSHLIFQFSKSLELIIQYIRKTLNLPPFITISQGQQNQVQGHLKYCHNLYDLIHVQSLIQHQNLIVLLESADGTEEIPSNVIGILLKHDLPQLSHLAIRARQSGCIFVCCENDEVFNKIHQGIQGEQYCQMSLINENVSIERASIKVDQQTTSQGKEETKIEMKIESKSLDILRAKFAENSFDIIKEFEEANLTADASLLGSKSVNSLKLREICSQHNFHTPDQVTVPMTIPLYFIMKDAGIWNKYEQLIQNLDSSPIYMIQPNREKIIKLLTEVYQAFNHSDLENLVLKLQEHLKQLPNDSLVAVRSSSTLEDLNKMAGAGLFDSYLNIQLNDEEQLINSIVDVWLSLFTERAIISRNQYGISSFMAQMSVLIQQQIHSDFSFIIHTENPVNNNTHEIYIEIAVGLGETLASANQQGTPYRLIYDKRNGECQIMSFANYSKGLFAVKKASNAEYREVDYSNIQYSQDPVQLEELGRQLGKIGSNIEESYGGQAQDIEGAIVIENNKPKIYVVQTRNQV